MNEQLEPDSKRWVTDSRIKYEAITERNRDRLVELQAISAKSPWAKWYNPVSGRKLSATLLNAFRVGVDIYLGLPGPRDPRVSREELASVTRLALSDPSDPRAARAIEKAILEVRRLRGLLDPARRVANPWCASGPDPELTADEHSRVENILRAWLFDALAEFSR
jgi:hypothetical protein